MGDPLRNIKDAPREFPGVCTPLVHGGFLCKIDESGTVAQVDAASSTIMQPDGTTTAFAHCLRYDRVRNDLRWNHSALCLSALAPSVAELQRIDRQAAQEMTSAVNVLRLVPTQNAVELLHTNFPTLLQLLVEVGQSPEINVHPMVIAALLNIEAKWLLHLKNGLGPGQVEPRTRAAMIRTPQFQRAWRRMHGNLPMPIPPAQVSALADILIVGVLCARMRMRERQHPGLLVPRFAEKITPHTVPTLVRQALAMRVHYGYPGAADLAHRVFVYGAEVARDAEGVRPGFDRRLDAFGRIAQRLFNDYGIIQRRKPTWIER